MPASSLPGVPVFILWESCCPAKGAGPPVSPPCLPSTRVLSSDLSLSHCGTGLVAESSGLHGDTK